MTVVTLPRKMSPMETRNLKRDPVHALVPAAGSGLRMGGDLPKQYLALHGRPVVAHALAALLAVPCIETVSVVLSPQDGYWEDYDWPDDLRLRVLRVGGATRAQTVANGLAALARVADESAWVMVHDAARACLAPQYVETLISTLADDPVGGLLAVPVADTLKRADANGRVAETIPRTGLWQAQTPQMFRLGLLRRALAAHPEVTDEAGAVEALGLAPRLVAADAANFKVTFPLDLQLAERLLASPNEASS